MARIAWAFIRRDFLLAISYRAAFAMQMLGIVLTVPILFYISRVFAGVEASSLEPYGGQYFPFLLLGIAFQDYMTFSQSAFNTSIREHQLMGTLEILMISPTPVPVVLLCSSLWGFVFTSARFALYLLLGLGFGLDLSHVNIPSLALMTSLTIASFSGLGILTASLTLVIKRSEGVSLLVSGVTVALSGVLYPVSVLPARLQAVAEVLPFTHALSGMRKAILKGAGPGELLAELSVMMAFAAVLFLLGLWTFSLATRHARVTGTLGQY